MKLKDAVALVEVLTGNRFLRVLAILIALLLLFPAATAFVLALSAL